ncbi:MAG: hypothetical protein KDD94_00820 [Calditrichaeota bacterium]|nr:hypothetical protein [Calditrichota bacterium]
MKLFLAILIIVQGVFAQAETRRVIPGEHYKAGGFFRFLFGDHWRDLWTSPIDVPVIDLNTFKGGLTPIKEGGGFQTKSLRFQAGNGKRYKFRSLDKDPRLVLPEDLRDTFAADIFQDQISTAHPLAPIIVVPMLNAVGVLNAPAQLVILPDDERLGEYRSTFANLLGMIEEHPDDYDDKSLNFAGADKLNLTYSLFEKMQKSSKHRVDQIAFLKARVLDVFFGDWDRHQDQWKWAGFEDENGLWLWKPVPRDRDQPFAKYDGLFPWVTALAVPQIEGFSANYPEIEDLTYSGRFLDRRFLNQLTKTEWDSICQEIKSILSNDLIERSVHLMPDDWFAISGQELIDKLISRRDQLTEAIDEYYQYLAKYAWIYGTNDKEYAEITRYPDGSVLVEVYDVKKSDKKNRLIFKRLFDPDYTNEIRLLLDDDDDEVVIQGDVSSSIDLIIDTGDGADRIEDNSSVGGFLSSSTKTYIYDSGKKTDVISGPSTKWIDRKFPKPDTITDIFEPQIKDYDFDWKGSGFINSNRDDGIVFQGGPILYYHSYHNNPYNYRLSLSAAFATKTRKGRSVFTAEFLELIPNTRVYTSIGFDWLRFTRFYGLGNNTVLTDEPESDFYRFGQRLFNFDQQFSWGHKHHLFTIGIGYENSKLELDAGTFVDSENLLGTESLDLLKFEINYKFDTWREESKNPDRGLTFILKSTYYPNIFTNSFNYDFRDLTIDFRKYYGIADWFNFSIRIAGKKKWGVYPFYHSAFLGSKELLRGFNRERFAGEAMVVSNLEGRFDLGKVRVLIPARLGLLAFADVGRVFVRHDKQKNWHNSFGSGFFLSVFKSSGIATFTYANSKEADQFYFGLGFDF